MQLLSRNAQLKFWMIQRTNFAIGYVFLCRTFEKITERIYTKEYDTNTSGLQCFINLKRQPDNHVINCVTHLAINSGNLRMFSIGFFKIYIHQFVVKINTAGRNIRQFVVVTGELAKYTTYTLYGLMLSSQYNYIYEASIGSCFQRKNNLYFPILNIIIMFLTGKYRCTLHDRNIILSVMSMFIMFLMQSTGVLSNQQHSNCSYFLLYNIYMTIIFLMESAVLYIMQIENIQLI